MENRIIEILSNNSRLAIPDLKMLFQQGESKDTAFALSQGIIQEIKEPNLPPNEVFLVMNFV